MAIQDKKHFLVVDDQEQKTYDEIGQDSLIFSPDSKRVAYVAIQNEKHFVVVDGKRQNPYCEVREDSLVFSPDSKLVTYMAKQSKKWLAIVDGEEGRAYDIIPIGSKIVFDTTNQFHYIAINDKAIYYIEENIL